MAQNVKTKSTMGEGTYGIQAWDEKTWEGKDHKDIHGAKLTHAKIRQDYHGVFEGLAESQLVMSYLDDANATYLGLQKMTGRIGDRSGAFVMQVNGSFANGAATSTFSIIPGSGTGDLIGIQGGGETVAVHADTQTYTLNYSFE